MYCKLHGSDKIMCIIACICIIHCCPSRNDRKAWRGRRRWRPWRPQSAALRRGPPAPYERTCPSFYSARVSISFVVQFAKSFYYLCQVFLLFVPSLSSICIICLGLSSICITQKDSAKTPSVKALTTAKCGVASWSSCTIRANVFILSLSIIHELFYHAAVFLYSSWVFQLFAAQIIERFGEGAVGEGLDGCEVRRCVVVLLHHTNRINQ